MKLTNTLTQFEPTFHQNPMSPAILQRTLDHLLNNKTLVIPKFQNVAFVYYTYT